MAEIFETGKGWRWGSARFSSAATACIHCGMHFATDATGIAEYWWTDDGRGPLHKICMKELLRAGQRTDSGSA